MNRIPRRNLNLSFPSPQDCRCLTARPTPDPPAVTANGLTAVGLRRTRSLQDPGKGFFTVRSSGLGMARIQLFVADFDTCLVWELLLPPSNAKTAPNVSSLMGSRWRQ